ncbi:carbohydrate binding domain-containing protein [Sanguibacter sp. HDW7]|uniref:carbohydrate binding domain-containing protein n=1 Tax=Sanguibacter sp. HDW7 TaxID=2714931 RepID=UPI00140CC132|nr:carbohydrate binding domain-containing protein [Sanguibacter sp. HDW7]QIK84188.1 hypothetical protein G7063_11595 [Sanguibacter sp. HDW7]
MHHPVQPSEALRERRGRRLLAAAAAVAVAGSGLAALALPAQGATPQPTTSVSSPNGRGDVILNMFQWSWNAIAQECTTTIGPAGFGYVQTSPPQEHIQGTEWWTSYQPVSYKIESKLGTRAEYQNMINTCKKAGVGIIADAVVNHMAGADKGGGTGTGGSSYSVENYPGLYGPNDFNDCKSNINNYGDRSNVQNCRLVSLQDLRTSSDYVRTKIAGYFNDLISMGVAGFRIDAAKHIPAADLEAIKAKLSKPDVFWVHEVIGAHGEPIQPSEYLGSGDSHEFHYARDLKTHFDGQIKNLRSIGDGKLPSNRAGVFVDNHDTERNGETMNYKWGAKYTLANAFMLAWPYGSPSVYTGYTWTDKDAGAPGATGSKVPDASCSSSSWTCIQRKPEITGMVKFHNLVAGTSVTNWWDNGNNQVAFGRGDKGFLVLNNEASPSTRTYSTSLPAGTYTDVVSATGKTYTVNGAGQFTATVPQYGALALVKAGTTPTDPPTTTNPTDPTTPPASGAMKVFYKSAWSSTKVHYKVGSGAWTTAPGVAMTPACDGYVSAEIPGGASGVTAAFNNGAGSWDNNGSKDYALTGASVVVADGAATQGDPCAPVADTTTVYYPKGTWATTNIHFKVGSGAWTAVPGVRMAPACDGWLKHTIDSKGAKITAVFTDGAGAWDNNGSKDYTLSGETVQVKNGAVSAGSPCAPEPTDPPTTTEPTDPPTTEPGSCTTEGKQPLVPTGLKAVLDGGTATVTWNAPRDSECAVLYTVVREGGAFASKRDVAGPSITDDGLASGLTYTYKVRAEGADGQASAYSAKVTAAAATEPTDPPTTDPTTDPTDEPTDEPTTGPTTPPTGGSAEGPYYATNPSGQKGKQKTITVDGVASEWTSDMIVAQGVANDDPRIFRGSHEGPVYDLYSLSGAWDDTNLYLMWQITNVTDVTDPGQGYPISDNGKPTNGDIPFQLAFDTDSTKQGSGLIDGTTGGVWGINNKFTNGVDKLAMFSAKSGVGQPSIFSLNAGGAFDYKTANVLGFTAGGVKYKAGDGFTGSTLMGVKKNGYEGYTPADLTDASKYSDLLKAGHNKAQDTFYEMSIPLALLGMTKAKLESQGLGVQLISTFGQSGINSLPHDPTVLDNATKAYSADESTSMEKEDWDTFSVSLARIGK